MNGLNQRAIARYLKQSVGVFFAGMLLMLTVACSGPDAPMASEKGADETGSSSLSENRIFSPTRSTVGCVSGSVTRH